MIRHAKTATTALAATTLLGLALACGGSDDTTGPGDDGPTAASVEVSPDSAATIAGQTADFDATVLSSDGDTLNRSPDWSVSDTSVATVGSDGLATGKSAGVIDVTATVDGVSASGLLHVDNGPPPSAARSTPDVGTAGTEVKVVGTDFRDGARVFFNEFESDSVDVIRDTLLFALAPDSVSRGTSYDLTVRNQDDTEATLSSAFDAIAPELEFINGATRPSGQEGSTVVLDGRAFGDLQGQGQVVFFDGVGATIEAESDWTDTFILTTVPSGASDGGVVVKTATGTSDSIYFNVTSGANFSPSDVDWTQTASLPTAVSGHSADFVRTLNSDGSFDRWVHVVGGASNDSVPRMGVHFADVQSDGSLGTWMQTSQLPAGRAFHATVAATPFNSRVDGDGYLYALGGIETKGGGPVTSVLRAPINGDATVGSWSEVATLPQPLHSLEAAIFRSNIYVSGGATTSDDPVATVYRAPVDTLGNLGSWQSLQSLPDPRAYHEMTVIGNCLHVFDGDSASFDPNLGQLTDTRYLDIARTTIDLRSDDLADAGWSIDDTQPPKARNRHTALIAGGVVLRTAGWYDGIGTSGSSENQFAQIQSSCDVGDFNGANNQNSIKSKGGGNLFNHAAVSFVDGSGTAHVMILGGDDVDSPGDKRSAVWFY